MCASLYMNTNFKWILNNAVVNTANEEYKIQNMDTPALVYMHVCYVDI